MSSISRFALRAFKSFERPTASSAQYITRRAYLVDPLTQSKRTFYSRSSSLAQATGPVSSSSTATAAQTEDALNPDAASSSAATIFPVEDADPTKVDWTKSFHGLSNEAFPKEAADILLAPINQETVEIKPDGIVYLPEIHYRRILNRAFGPGAWGLAPRGETIVTDKCVTREYCLLAHGRLVSIARGEQDYFSKDGIPTASEGCKSNAMVRCCKDLGIASELWDPRFIRQWKAKNAREVFVEHVNTKKRTKIWLRKGDPVNYPFKETNGTAAKPATTG